MLIHFTTLHVMKTEYLAINMCISEYCRLSSVLHAAFIWFKGITPNKTLYRRVLSYTQPRIRSHYSADWLRVLNVVCCYKLYLMLVAHCKAKLFPCGNTCPKRYNCIRNNFVYILCIKCVHSAQWTTYTAYQVWCIYFSIYLFLIGYVRVPRKKWKFRFSL